jgi:hypothetical protein
MATDMREQITVTLSFDRGDLEDMAQGIIEGDNMTDKEFQAVKKTIEEAGGYFEEILDDVNTIQNLVEEALTA